MGSSGVSSHAASAGRVDDHAAETLAVRSCTARARGVDAHHAAACAQHVRRVRTPGEQPVARQAGRPPCRPARAARPPGPAAAPARPRASACASSSSAARRAPRRYACSRACAIELRVVLGDPQRAARVGSQRAAARRRSCSSCGPAVSASCAAESSMTTTWPMPPPVAPRPGTRCSSTVTHAVARQVRATAAPTMPGADHHRVGATPVTRAPTKPGAERVVRVEAEHRLAGDEGAAADVGHQPVRRRPRASPRRRRRSRSPAASLRRARARRARAAPPSSRTCRCRTATGRTRRPGTARSCAHPRVGPAARRSARRGRSPRRPRP
jgi:hypothetical protein